jgi:hypothetical protein
MYGMAPAMLIMNTAVLRIWVPVNGLKSDGAERGALQPGSRFQYIEYLEKGLVYFLTY